MTPVFANRDTRKQLPAGSRHIVMKHFSKWTCNREQRTKILFREYPAIEEACRMSMGLTRIYSTASDKQVGLTRLARWYGKAEKLNLREFDIRSPDKADFTHLMKQASFIQ
jgi:hypothetical protein